MARFSARFIAQPIARSLVVVVAALALPALAEPSFDHSDYDAILRKVVDGTRVDYAKVEKARPRLKAYLQRIADLDPSKLTTTEDHLSFYTNAYNAHVLEAVLEQRVTESVMKAPGFFDKIKHKVAGEELTLNELEEKKLRSHGDPRVHFVVNCASLSCPRLWQRAYTAQNWSEAIEARTKEYLDRRGEVVVDNGKKTITVVKLFEWYQKDWGGEREAREFIARYVPRETMALHSEDYKLVTREYDWNLNKK